MAALIFDCDGVLVDSEQLSAQSWVEVLARRGVRISVHQVAQLAGRSDRAVIHHLSRVLEQPLPSEVATEREEEYLRLARTELKPFAGVASVLQSLRKRRVRLAVASSSSVGKLQFSLEHTGLVEFFEVVCSVSEVQRGKPAPDLFLRTAERLGVSPRECRVIEDSLFGVQAARAAEMKAVGFSSTHSEQALREAGAEVVFSSYGDFEKVFAALDGPG